MKKIYYHGTNKKNAKQILKNGFKKGTYFADHLEDALGYGGSHIFGVCIDFKFGKGRRATGFDWQVICANAIKPKNIVFYKIYQMPETVFENQELRDEIFNEAMKRYKKTNVKED